jgi:hypothetical protein
MAAACPFFNTCREKDLEIGVRENNRADIPPFHDPAFLQSQFALKRHESLPHLGKGGHRRSHQGAFGAPDFLSDIVTIDKDHSHPICRLDLESMSIHQLDDAS